MAPRPVPEETWLPLQRRYERNDQLSKLSHGAMMAACAVAIVDGFVNPKTDFTWWWRLAIPLWLIGVVWGLFIIIDGHLVLRRMRRLMAEYHEQDPE
jgi:hypothetical protein